MTASESGSRLTASVSPARREGPAELGSELIRAKDPVTIVIFGASGDLAKRKLIPALYHLQESRLPAGALRGDRLLAHADDATRRIASVMRKALQRDGQRRRRGGLGRPPARAGALLPGRRRRQARVVPVAQGEDRAARARARACRAIASSTSRSRRSSSRSSSRISPPPASSTTRTTRPGRA